MPYWDRCLVSGNKRTKHHNSKRNVRIHGRCSLRISSIQADKRGECFTLVCLNTFSAGTTNAPKVQTQAESLAVPRTNGLSREEVNNFHQLLIEVLADDDILDKPERIYYLDESIMSRGRESLERPTIYSSNSEREDYISPNAKKAKTKQNIY
ncbi:hypothetical protein HHI36_004545 [Cryptolaemus montrouzieri]|uniref:Transposase n=1 Tax=Cryptolaemus montrouzieri TaxID=559131 RepID=A0ABD2NRI4_9CUCU